MEFYSTDNLAQMFGVHKRTIIREMDRGKLLFSRVGNKRRVSEDQLNQYIENKTARIPTVKQTEKTRRGRSDKGLEYKVFDPV
jgi:excisionase family DNA binding protein